MGKFKINFKDSNCQFVEDYNAGKYGTKVKIYFCEGDGCCPKQYSGSVGTEMITAETIDDLKKKLDDAVAKRDKEIAKSLTDSKKKVKAKDKEEYSYYQVVYAYDNEELSEEFNSRKEAIKYYNNLVNDKKLKYAELKKVEGTENNDLNDERITILKSFNNDSIKDGKGCVNFKDTYDDLDDEWDYEITCEGNQWADGGFDSAEEAEDNALAKVNELLEDFPEGYAVDDFDITFRNSATGESYTYDPYDIRDCNMATLTPGTVNLKRASKKFNQKDCGLIKSRNKKFRDASADEIIDLFEEAYIKGRTWDWLKNKLPSKFLNMQNKHWKNIFPIQADRTGKLEGVYLTKPKSYTNTEDFKNRVNSFIDNLDHYISYVQHLDSDYGIELDTYNWDKVVQAIKKAIEDTDSKKQSEELSQILKNIRSIWDDLRESSWGFDRINLYSNNIDDYADIYSKGEDALRKYIIDKEKKSIASNNYKEDQKKPIIYNREGGYIRSDSKVGPLSEEAKSYIRRVMGNSTTEEMEAKRELRQSRRQPYFYGTRGNEGIKKFDKEISDIKELLRGLKSELAKEKRMDIDVSNRKHGYLKYTGKGHYDWNGRYKSNGGYEYTDETQPTTVAINIQGLNGLSVALGRILNSGSVDEVEKNLQYALEVVKDLPRNNPKVAEIKAKIKALLENRKNAQVVKKPLPDKKFVKDSFNGKELKEYIELCKKLGLLTQGDVQNFSKKHGNVTDKKLLEELRKEANKK